MPYKLSDDGLGVMNADTGEMVKRHKTHADALAHLKALEANVPEAHAERVAFEPFRANDWHKPVKILPLGTFYRGSRVLTIDEARAQEIVNNFKAGLPRYGVSINVEHGNEPSQPGAIGTVKEVAYIPGEGVYATAMDFTGNGQQLLDEDRYQGVSPEVVWTLNENAKYQDPQTGEWRDNVLVGLALTTSPFFGKSVQVFSATAKPAAETMADPPPAAPPVAPAAPAMQPLDMLNRMLAMVGAMYKKMMGPPADEPTAKSEPPKQEAPAKEAPKEQASDPTPPDVLAAQTDTERDLNSGGETMSEPTITAEQFAELQAKAALVEKLTAQLTQEQTARQELEGKFNAEQKLRRLAEFVEGAESFSALAQKPADLGAHLLWLHDADPTEKKEHFAYFEGVLKAANAAAEHSQIFDAIGTGRTREGEPADPFLAAVEKVRVERFKDMPQAEGFAKAFNAASEEQPELAYAYAMATRGGRR